MSTSDFFRKRTTRSIKANNRGKKSALVTKMNSTIQKRNDPVFARKFVTLGVIVSAIMVGVSLFVTVYYNPEAVAKRNMDFLARTYYETYYYDKFVEAIDEDSFEERMRTYERTGLQPVMLRQLLLYNNGKYSSYKEYFENDSFKCDKNKTSAKFYPKSPYGPKDYRVEYEYSCTSN